MAKKPKILGRDDLLSLPKMELVEIPDKGGAVWVRAMNGKDQLLYREKVTALKDDKGELSRTASFDAKVFASSLCICDESGNPLYSEADVLGLMNNSEATINIIFTKILVLSGYDLSLIGKLNEAKNKLKNAPKDSSTTS